MHDIYLFKVAVIGDSMVGKTSIVQTLISGGTMFSKNYNMTSDVILNVKDIIIPDSKDIVQLILYDSAGNSLYEDFLPKFWNKLNAIVGVYDITSQGSFNSLKKWIDMADRNREQSPDGISSNYSSPGVIFANKTDLDVKRVISTLQGKTVASGFGLEYFEGSAKSNIAVEEAFQFLAKELHSKANEMKE